MDTREITPSRYPWSGYTMVVSAVFETQMDTGACTLNLDLAMDNFAGSPALSLRFEGIVDLNLQGFGGGISQIAGLSVRDIAAQQWDRQAYEVYDDERGVIRFRCRTYNVARRYTI
jgi:hypothetical protein